MKTCFDLIVSHPVWCGWQLLSPGVDAGVPSEVNVALFCDGSVDPIVPSIKVRGLHFFANCVRIHSAMSSHRARLYDDRCDIEEVRLALKNRQRPSNRIELARWIA